MGGIFKIASVNLFVMNYVLKGVTYLIGIFDSSFFIVGGIVLGGASLSYYGTIVCLSGIMNLKGKVKLITPIVLATVCAFSCIFTNLADYNSIKLHVSGSDNFAVTVIIS